MLGFKIDTMTREAWFTHVDGVSGCAPEIGCPVEGVRTVFRTIDGHEYAFVCRGNKYTSEDPIASVVDKKMKGVIVDTCVVLGVENGAVRALNVDECNQLYDEVYLISDGTIETQAVMVD